MDATAQQQQWTKELIDQLEEANFASEDLMDRIEQMISNRDLLEQYTTVLSKRVRGSKYPSATMQDRLQRLYELLQQLDEREKQGEGN